MITDPDIIFADDQRQGLVARSGWDREEARTVLRGLGWEWDEELHALVPPDDVTDADAGVQAVKELHLHGYYPGLATGPYGIMPLNLQRAERAFAKLAPRPSDAPAEDDQAPTTRSPGPAEERDRPGSLYGPDSEQPPPEVPFDTPSI